MIESIYEGDGIITVKTNNEVIDILIEDFAHFFTHLHSNNNWQFPTRWRQSSYTGWAGDRFVYYPGINSVELFIKRNISKCIAKPLLFLSQD